MLILWPGTHVDNPVQRRAEVGVGAADSNCLSLHSPVCDSQTAFLVDEAASTWNSSAVHATHGSHDVSRWLSSSLKVSGGQSEHVACKNVAVLEIR